MPNRSTSSSDSKSAAEIRIAKQFKVGDRVYHCNSNKAYSGTITEIDFKLATPNIWVVWDDLGDKVPKPYSPSELVKHVEGLEKLSKAEEDARRQLETKIEKAFYEAGSALRELKERRLYRSTHKNFEEYCQDRFSFTRRHVNYLIAGSQIVENIHKGTIGSLTPPTSERQVRPLISLEPNQQCEVWQQAVEASNGKAPPARIVKSIVDELRAGPPLEELDSPHEPGDLVIIKAPNGALAEQKRHNGSIAVVDKINNWSVSVYVEGEPMEYRSDDLQPIENYNADIKDVVQKANQLLARKDLDPLNRGIVRLYLKQQSFSQFSIDMLHQIWEHYFEPEDSI
jgi:hypothetical protein